MSNVPLVTRNPAVDVYASPKITVKPGAVTLIPAPVHVLPALVIVAAPVTVIVPA